MVNGIDTEDKIKRVIFDRKGVGRTHLKFNFFIQSLISRISSGKVNHHRRKINPFKSNLRNGPRYKDGENSRSSSDINGPSPLNPLSQNPFENPPARDLHISFGHEVVIF